MRVFTVFKVKYIEITNYSLILKLIVAKRRRASEGRRCGRE
jgi:hypothetical protein